jgi:hypothetical protein
MRYNEIMIEGRLSKDIKSRMNRALAMGFDTEHLWYHGTKKSIRKFNMRLSGNASGSYHELPAIFLTSDPKEASHYANVGQKMSSGSNWGEYRDKYLEPMKQILSDPRTPRMMATWAESILQGHIDLDAMEREKYIEPDILAKIRKVLLAQQIENEESVTAHGATVMPLLVRGNFVHSSMTDDFDEFMYNLHLKHAKKNGLDGVWFNSVVDTTSGYGDEADVLAVLDRTLIRSKFAIFDPMKASSPDLMA